MRAKVNDTLVLLSGPLNYMLPVRLRDGLLNAAETWSSWDEITTIMNQQTIADFLHMCLQVCRSYYHSKFGASTTHRCYPDYHDELNKLRTLDIAGINTCIAQILQQPKKRELFMNRTGDDAQLLVDVLQGVR